MPRGWVGGSLPLSPSLPPSFFSSSSSLSFDHEYFLGAYHITGVWGMSESALDLSRLARWGSPAARGAVQCGQSPGSWCRRLRPLCAVPGRTHVMWLSWLRRKLGWGMRGPWERLPIRICPELVRSHRRSWPTRKVKLVDGLRKDRRGTMEAAGPKAYRCARRGA